MTTLIAPTKIKNNQTIQGTKFIKFHEFSNGCEVPIYEVSTVNGLNQIIGYVKYINKDYGTVYYRGEVHLHESLKPSAARGTKNPQCRYLADLLNNICNDEKCNNIFNSNFPHQKWACTLKNQ